MKIKLSPGLFALGFLLLQGGLNAQDNQEPGHACFRLDPDRELPIPLMQNKVGQGLYSCNFSRGNHWSGKQVFLKIPEIGSPYRIRINDFNFGNDPGSGRAAEFNITPFVKDEYNTIELELDLPDGGMEIMDCPWCGGATLLIRDAIHVRDLWIKSYRETGTAEILIRFHLFIKSYLTGKNSNRDIQLQVTDPAGNMVINAERKLASTPSFGQETEMIIDETLMEAMLWSPANPNLYRLELSLSEKEGEGMEFISTTFGIRFVHMAGSMVAINGDTLHPVTAGPDLTASLPGLSETEIRKLVEDRVFNAVIAPEPLPCNLVELFDRTGALLLINKDRTDPRTDPRTNPSLVNSPSVVWIE